MCLVQAYSERLRFHDLSLLWCADYFRTQIYNQISCDRGVFPIHVSSEPVLTGDSWCLWGKPFTTLPISWSKRTTDRKLPLGIMSCSQAPNDFRVNGLSRIPFLGVRRDAAGQSAGWSRAVVGGVRTGHLGGGGDCGLPRLRRRLQLWQHLPGWGGNVPGTLVNSEKSIIMLCIVF